MSDGAASSPKQEPPTLMESGAIVGGYRWIEMRLFECLGRWATTVDQPEITAMLDRHARHQAWHADLWQQCLPVLAGLEADGLTTAPDDQLAQVVEVLDQPDESVVKLAGVYRVVFPRLLAALRAHRAVANSVADAATIRIVGVVERDLFDDWIEGEALVQQLARESQVVRALAAHQVVLEELFARSRGLGPGLES